MYRYPDEPDIKNFAITELIAEVIRRLSFINTTFDETERLQLIRMLLKEYKK